MAAVIDLTLGQLNEALNQLLNTRNENYILYDTTSQTTSLNLTKLLRTENLGANVSESTGVLKGISLLFDAARIAQEAANEGKPAGQKLNTFLPPTNAAPANNFVAITRSIVTRADLRSATKIVGTNV